MTVSGNSHPVIVDASIGIKWVVHEVHSAESIALIDERLRLIVPDLFYLEVGNILGKKADRGEISPDKAGDLYGAVFEAPLVMQPSVPLIKQALDLAINTRRALYDSIYLTIALSVNGVYATADERFINGLAQMRPDLISHTLWVADIPKWLDGLPSTPP